MTAEKDYLSLPLQTFLTDLAAKSPTPGGGSVAALTGAVAAAQAKMVVQYTAGNARYAEHEDAMQTALAEFGRAEAALTQLMNEDMAAYERYAASRRSDDADEKRRAIATAAAVPMEIAAMAATLLTHCDDVKDKVNRYLFSDLKVAAILAFASVRAAAANVRINLDQFDDRNEADQLEQQLTQLIEQAHQHRSSIVHHEVG